MKVRLAYGRTGLDVNLPDENVTVVAPQYVPGLEDEAEAIRQALRQPIGTAPLKELVRADDTVAIVFSDITRPMPNDRVLPVLLAELAHVPRENVVLIDALGTHRHNTHEELVGLLGEEIVARYRVINHEAYNKEQLVNVGRTRQGADVWVNAEFMRASVRILTGFIEPHEWAGFSGGGKSVLPGIAWAETVMHNHSVAMIDNPKVTYGVTDGNPMFADMREAGLLTRPTFLLNVTLNKDHRLTGVFAGDLAQAHDAGIEFVRRTAMYPLDEPFDVVLTTNSGYPLDLDLYQSVKGINVAAMAAKPGGSIVIATACPEGLGHGHFGKILQMRATPRQVLEMIREPGFHMVDQADAQSLCNVLVKHQVFVYSDGLSEEQARAAHLIPVRDIATTVEALLAEYGPGARVAVLPEGPQVVPYVR